MHTYRFVFTKNRIAISYFIDFIAENKKEASKKWTAWKKTENYTATLIDIIKIN